MTEPGLGSAIVSRVVPAPPDVVYGEWLDPAALAEFICPEPVRAGPIECDPRVGGKLRIVMIGTDVVVQVTGEYLELDRPSLLRFTWNSDMGGGFSSVVTVTLEPHGDGQTFMTIDHRNLPRDLSGDHQGGWTRIAGQLSCRLETDG
jgi:uncharacterized protein YndB with AHSA1/START domain